MLYSIKCAVIKPRITWFSPHDSHRTLVSENPNIVQKFEEGHPYESDECDGWENFALVSIR